MFILKRKYVYNTEKVSLPLGALLASPLIGQTGLRRYREVNWNPGERFFPYRLIMWTLFLGNSSVGQGADSGEGKSLANRLTIDYHLSWLREAKVS